MHRSNGITIWQPVVGTPMPLGMGRLLRPEHYNTAAPQRDLVNFFDHTPNNVQASQLQPAAAEGSLEPINGCQVPDAVAAERGTRVTCPACSQELRRVFDLMKHIEQSCSGREHRYKCKSCGAETTSKDFKGSDSRSAPKHEWRHDYTYLPKYFGCPCCGMYLKDFKAFQHHVLITPDHVSTEAYLPVGIGHVRRLRGLLQQPNAIQEVTKHHSASQTTIEWLRSLHWDHEYARLAAKKLEHRFLDPREDLQELGLSQEDTHAFVREVLSNRMQSLLDLDQTSPASVNHGSHRTFDDAGPPLQQIGQTPTKRNTVLRMTVPPECAFYYTPNNHGHKRVISIGSSQLVEAEARAHVAPEMPKERMQRPASTLRVETACSATEVPRLLQASSPQSPTPVDQSAMTPTSFDSGFEGGFRLPHGETLLADPLDGEEQDYGFHEFQWSGPHSL